MNIRAFFYGGDDEQAKQTAATLIADCDCEAVEARKLAAAWSLETLASAWVQFASAWVQFAAASNLFPRFGLKALRDSF